MQRTKIEWATHVWNPITGCLHSCRNDYCYAAAIARRFGGGTSREDGTCREVPSGRPFPFGFDPTFYADRLGDPAKLKKSSHIFAVSMGDMFGEWVPEEWIYAVLTAMDNGSQHAYTVLTKNPERLPWFPGAGSLKHARYGTSIDCLGSIDGEPVGDEYKRIIAIKHFGDYGQIVLSLEPLLGQIDPVFLPANLSWLIIGGLTGSKSFHPPIEWIMPIIDWADRYDVPIFCKDNLGYPGLPQEYPEGVPHD